MKKEGKRMVMRLITLEFSSLFTAGQFDNVGSYEHGEAGSVAERTNHFHGMN